MKQPRLAAAASSTLKLAFLLALVAGLISKLNQFQQDEAG